ncbi:MAG: TolC family protein [Planctomycetes bacterium]|nr:TolC family protein [Planctomycetota bacterium]
MQYVRATTSLLALISVLLVGCESPLAVPDDDFALSQRVIEALSREIESLTDTDQFSSAPSTSSSELEETLANRREELEALGPDLPFIRENLDLGTDLTGKAQTDVAISLKTALTTAIQWNLGIQSTRLGPAINEKDVIAAQAAFDALFVTNIDLTKTDEPSTVAVIRGAPLGIAFNASERYRFETGVRKLFETGAVVSVTTDLTRFRNLTTGGFSISPDPAYTSALRLGLTQPLLRGFGSRVNQSTIHLARNSQSRSIEQLRTELLQLVSDVEIAYWDLVFAWQNLSIQQWLLDSGIEVREFMRRRGDFDVKPAEMADAVAKVEQRKANVINARRAVRRASDSLKVLINAKDISIGSESLLLPIDKTVQEPLRFNLREVIVTAVSGRPEVKQAMLEIDDAKIRQHLANNARLPLLNLSAQIAYFGLDDDVGSSYDEIGEGSFIDYILGIALEVPIGNREAEAGYKKARLERSSAAIKYQRTIQNVILEVKTALRDVITDNELIQVSRSFRIAQAENLRTFLVSEQLQALNPVQLNLKFQRQETLALAQQDEVRSLVNYNKSVARLYRAMGTGLSMNRIELNIDDGGFDDGSGD